MKTVDSDSSALQAAPPPGRRAWPPSAWPGAQYLEALFNAPGQQRGGFLFGLLRTVPGRGREHPVVAALASGPFNSHPVLAGYLAGVVAIRLARPARETDPAEAAEAIERIRATLAPVLSGLGDRLFWGGVRPVLSLIGMLSAFLWIGEPALWYWLGYNAVQLYWRRRSWACGLRGESAVREEIVGSALKRWTRVLSSVGRFLVGLAIGAVAVGSWREHGPTWCAVFLGVIALGFALARSRRVSPLGLGWIGIGLAGLVALARFELWRLKQ